MIFLNNANTVKYGTYLVYAYYTFFILNGLETPLACYLYAGYLPFSFGTARRALQSVIVPNLLLMVNKGLEHNLIL